MEVVAGHVGASISDVATQLFASNTRAHDRYLLLGTIASTHRSTVFAAVDQLLARDVALKVLHDAEDQTTWQLLAEVQAMTQCDHPNVVRVSRHQARTPPRRRWCWSSGPAPASFARPAWMRQGCRRP
jgi:hypothetical protein